MDIHVNDILKMKKPHPCGCGVLIHYNNKTINRHGSGRLHL
jgi:hypothetical protein